MSAGVLGGVGLTVLDVYDQRPGPDGEHAGCAHVHAVTDEAYFGLRGEGAVELHDPRSGFTRAVIRSGTFVQFRAGTVHRSVSTKGLRVLAIMGNAGLAEQGDARIYFGAEVDADPDGYAALRALAENGLDGALERRDASAAAYGRLLSLWESDREAWRAELERFLAVHRDALEPQRAGLEEAIRAGPLRAGQVGLSRLAAVAGDDDAGVERWDPDTAPTFGMCGLLRQVQRLEPAFEPR